MTKPKARPALNADHQDKGILTCILQHRTEGLLLASMLFFIYCLISYFYPAPSGSNDTPNYILCAINKAPGGYRPYGYSGFLGLVNMYSQSAKSVFTAQYIIFSVSVLYLYYAVRLLFEPRNKLMNILLLLAFVASPCLIYLTNYLMSDSLSASLTNFWLASLLCFIYNKNLGSLAIHFITTFFCIEVRYSALLYPVFTFAVMLLVYRKSLFSLLAVIPVVITFMIHSKTVRQTKKLSQVAEFSAFSGWQLASNALIIHPYTNLTDKDLPNEEMKEIHQVAESIPDSVYIKNGIIAGYMWDDDKPLKLYLHYFRTKYKIPYLTAYIMCGSKFRNYGKLVIRKHPGAFVRHYFLPNLMMMYDLPDTDILGEFQAPDVGNMWFNDAVDNKLKAPEKDVFALYFKSSILTGNKIRLIIFGITCLLLIFLLTRKKLWEYRQRFVTTLLLSFTLISLLFLAFASPVCYRYILMVIYPMHILMYIAGNTLFKNTVKVQE